MMRMIMLLALAATIACEGQIAVPDLPDVPDMGAVVPDVAVSTDMPQPDLNTTPDPLCVGVTCGMNAECGRGQCWCSPNFMGDPNAGCTPGNPCAAADCTFGATCRDSGECVCDVGFEEDLASCTPTPIEFPEERTADDVCARWTRDYPETAGPTYQTAPPDQCTPGELDPAFQLDAVRRVSLYRWLVGLPAVTTTADYAAMTQACATALDAQNLGATNQVTEDFTCYSEQAAVGANASSVLRGAPTSAAAVDTFMEDANAASLGNRRWILNPTMGATAFGFRGDYTCMYAIDSNGASNPQFIAYPFSAFPAQALRGRWMWASNNLFSTDATTVTVVDADGGNVPITNKERLDGVSFPTAIVWDVAGVSPGEYTITVQGLSGAASEVTYMVNIVNCP